MNPQICADLAIPENLSSTMVNLLFPSVQISLDHPDVSEATPFETGQGPLI
jgi:hypothetical protein